MSPVIGQGQSFESLVKSIDGVNFSFSCWETRGVIEKKSDCYKEQRGFGVEISYEVGRVKIFGTSKKKAAKPKRILTEVLGKDVIVFEVPDSTEELSSYLLLELALGYGQFSGFRSADPSIDLRGVVREIPAISLYGSYNSDTREVFEWFSPYIGVRSGVIRLHDVQAIFLERDTLRSYPAAGEVFQVGGVVGLALGYRGISLFTEGAYQLRKFESVRWLATPGVLPPQLPRMLDFTGWTTSVGIQIDLKRD